MTIPHTVTSNKWQVTRRQPSNFARNAARGVVKGIKTQNSSLVSRHSSLSAFTMIEIALCLAIIGFALVAIIGTLPRGLNVQKQNREETIINQDAALWMNAIRSGAKGYDDLTNYIIGITNTFREYTINGGPRTPGRCAGLFIPAPVPPWTGARFLSR